jgi:tape measure domain-containing protein
VDIATLGLRVDGTGAIRTLDNFERAADRTARTTKRTESAARDLQRAFALLGGALAVREMIQYADTWAMIQGRIKLVTASTEQAAIVSERLFAAAQRSRGSMESMADLYSKLARNAGQLGVSQGAILQVTETISKAMVVSNASAQESAAAIRQLGQAMGSGALRGDELNSIMENSSELAAIIARGMGVTTGELRKMGAEGKLQSREVFQAIQSQAAEIEAKFAGMPLTIGQAMQVARNEMLKFVGTTSATSGAARDLADLIVSASGRLDEMAAAALKAAQMVGFLLRNIGSLITAGLMVAVVWLARSTAALVAQSAASLLAGRSMGLLVLQMRGATLGAIALAGASRGLALVYAALGGPIGLIVIGVSALAYAFWDAGRKAQEAAAMAEAAADRFRAALGKMNDATLQTTAEVQNQAFAGIVRSVQFAEAKLATAQAAFQGNTGTLRQVQDAERQLTVLKEIRAQSLINLQSTGEEIAQRAALAEQLKGNAPPPPAGTGESAREAARDLVASSLFEQRYGLFGDAFDRAKDLHTQVDSLDEALKKLGAAAPAAGIARLEQLRAELGLLSADMDRILARMQAGGLTPSTSTAGMGPMLAPAIGHRGYENVAPNVLHAGQGVTQQHRDQARMREDAARAALAKESFSSAVNTAVVGINDLAEALGDVSQPLRDALRGISSFTAGMDQFAAGQEKGGLAGLAGMIGGVGAMVGGAVTLIKAFTGPSENTRILRENNERLAELRDSLDASLFGGRNVAAAASVAARLGAMPLQGLQTSTGRVGETRYRDGKLTGGAAASIQEMLRASGLTFSQLLTMAEQRGITVLNESGMLLEDGFRQLSDALGISIESITKFGQGLDDIKKRQQAGDALYDRKGLGVELGNAYEILNQMAPDLVKQMGLGNLNLDTEAGRNVLLAGLRDIFELINSGDLTAELLGSFADKNQLIDAILAAKLGLDAFKGVLDDVTTDFPKATDLLFYEQLHATAPNTGGGAGGGGGGTALPPEGPARRDPANGGGGRTTINIDRIINEAGDSPEDLARKMEEACALIASRGGFVRLPGAVLS